MVEIQRQIDRANEITRDEALETSERKTMDRIPLVVTYHPDLPLLGKILHNHLPIFHVLERMKLATPRPPLVGNRRPRNLKELLTKATLKPSQHHNGSHGLGRPHCKTSAHVSTGTDFVSTVTGERFQANVDATCKTRNLAYFKECLRCRKQYVGETENPLRLWMNGDRSYYYRKLPDKSVGVHFNTMGHTFEDLTVVVIEQLGSSPVERRKLSES